MRATILTCLLFASTACGDEGSENPTPIRPAEEPAPETPSAPETNAPEVETAYAIHEWGFIAHHYADGEGELLTINTAPAPAFRRPANNHPHSRAIGKPVIYVHLQGEGNIARFNASLSTTGRFVEEWPDSARSTPARLTWDVEARRGSCSASGDYPVATDPHCTSIVDHYCEAAELFRYETEDSACLTIEGKEWNHLFYRAQTAGDVPLRVSKRGDVFSVRASAALPGRLIRIRRADDASDTRVVLFDAPAPGESHVLPAPDQPAAVGIAALQSELSALGMSEDEADAFMTAWQAELFGDTPERTQVEMVGPPPRALRPKAEVLIYFLPTATLDAMVPLAFTPPPTEVRRAVLVRIDLGEAYVPSGGTIGLGGLGHIRPSRPQNSDYRPPRWLVRVQQPSLLVDGVLSELVVRRVIRRHINEARFCGERHLSGVGTEADLELRFGVSATGFVEDALVSGGPAELNGCISAAVRRWTFPSPASGTVRVTAPMHFELYND